MKSIIDFVSSFIEWCNNNQGFTSIILSVVTFGITLYVMYKSNDNSKKISEKQAELEKNIALRQEDMQRRQIKVDTYPYRVDCWEKLYMLREETEILKTAFQVETFSNLSIREISGKLQPFYTTYKESVIALNRARNIFPVSSCGKIDYIKLCVEKNNSISYKGIPRWSVIETSSAPLYLNILLKLPSTACPSIGSGINGTYLIGIMLDLRFSYSLQTALMMLPYYTMLYILVPIALFGCQSAHPMF